MVESYQSWGRYPDAHPRSVTSLEEFMQGKVSGKPYLAYGLGSSYGDVCQNNDNILVDCRSYNQILAFDGTTGVVVAQAGCTIAELLSYIVPQGWFVPVTPGTKYVTLGGAVANDVHGKNHHHVGSFGHYVKSLDLFRSDVGTVHCSTEHNSELFVSTIGGMGLTGIITKIELQLLPIVSSRVVQRTIPTSSLVETMRLLSENDSLAEYSVSWIDSSARGTNLGRGHVFLGEFENSHNTQALQKYSSAKPSPVLAVLPHIGKYLLNSHTLQYANWLYYMLLRKNTRSSFVTLEKYFYPLDAIPSWNKVFGTKGFLQYQFVVPEATATEAITQILVKLQSIRAVSFVTVLKKFGSKKSIGMMSFPIEGYTLTLDIPVRCKGIFSVLDVCDSIVVAAGGKIYAAKDARMKPKVFQEMYPQFQEFKKYIDPACSSSFWRRVTQE